MSGKELDTSKQRKPAKNHPWKKQNLSTEVHKWNREQSYTPKANNLVTARPQFLERQGESAHKRNLYKG